LVEYYKRANNNSDLFLKNELNFELIKSIQTFDFFPRMNLWRVFWW